MPQHEPSYSESREGRTFAAASAAIVFLLLEGLVLAQAVFASRDHFLTVSQMRAGGVAQGLPFVWHFGMWGDLLLISPLAANLAGRYGRRWTLPRLLLSFALGASAAILFSFIYTLSAIPEAHVRNHRLTVVGGLHLVYMAAAVSILVQFVFFIRGVSRRLLTVVSILVLFHLFLGTHMILGLIGLMVRLDWYPGDPLKSVLGWATIAGVAAGLLWRRLSLAPNLRETWRRAVSRVAHFLMYWGEDDLYWSPDEVHTPRGLLRFWDSVGGHVLELSFFLAAAWTLWRRSACPASIPADLRSVRECLSNALLPCLLILVFGMVYRLSRRSVKFELAIAQRLFPLEGLPRQWGSPGDPVGITVSVVCFFLFYMALAWFAYDIRIVSFFMVVIAAIDWNGRRLIHRRIPAYFADERYAPTQTDPARDVIEARRDVVRQFLDSHPHLQKEAARVAGCAVALGVALSGYFYGAGWMKSLAYLVLIATLVANEIVTARWRAGRDRELIAIERRQQRDVDSAQSSGPRESM